MFTPPGAVTSGALRVGQTITGAGVAAGTVITALGTGTGGTGTYAVNNSQTVASGTLTGSGGLMTVTAIIAGILAVGQVIQGAGITAGNTITALGTGTGGTGTYFVSIGDTAPSTNITVAGAGVVVTFDSVSSAFVIASGITGPNSTMAFATGTAAASLALTQATGAVLSQGAAGTTPSSFMNAVIAVTTNWVTFTTLFDPDSFGNANKLAFAAWKNAQNQRYAYVAWDTDVTPKTTLPASSSLGVLLDGNGDSGTAVIWAPDATSGYQLAAFVMGAAASIDFTERRGRITFAFKRQAGIVPSVTDATSANNLGGSPQSAARGNFYNFYGAYAQASQNFLWYQRGFVTGDFLWLDAYINQIWLNSLIASAILTLMQNARSIPYDAAGRTLIETAIADPVAAGLNFGAFGPGEISAAQAAQVNAEAGAPIANTLQTQGSYLQVLPASSAVRAARGSPPVKFFYLDRGSVQAITVGSIAVN
jgi:hypothetical protein